MKNIEYMRIKNKDIYIFRDHHYALLPWASIRNQLSQAPILVSFDHHTDTHSPFLHFCAPGPKYKYNEKKAIELIKEIKFSEEYTIEKAVSNLKNDEHIKTGIEADIIRKAFIISYDNHFDTPLSFEDKKRTENFEEIMINRFMGIESPEEDIKRPFTYPDADIYIPKIDAVSIDLTDDELYDCAIETKFLKDKFDIFHQMCPQIVDENYFIKEKYILDIDLDYFHTINSINPKDAQFLYQMIKNSEIITIALEPVCVELVRKEKNVNSEMLLDRLLKHIENAL